MQDGFPAPPRLIIKESVFGEAARVDDAEMRTDAGPVVRRRLAAIIESRPKKSAREKRPRGVKLPPLFGGGSVMSRRVQVVGGDITSLGSFGVNAARAQRTGFLAANAGLRGKIGVEFVDAALVKIIEALHVENSRRARSPTAIHGERDRPAGVEAANQAFHRGGDVSARGRALKRLFVAERPEKNGWMIA